MNLQALLSEEAPPPKNARQMESPSHPYQPQISAGAMVTPSHSPSTDPKEVVFTLCISPYDSVQQKHQPLSNPTMKIVIQPHDTTESIASTVKAYFGLPASEGIAAGSCRVSFEDNHGNCMVISHENVSDGMNVFVRVLSGEPTPKSLPDEQLQKSDVFAFPPKFDDENRKLQYDDRSTSPSGSKTGKAPGIGASAMVRTKSNKRHGSATPTPESATDAKIKPEPVASAEISLDNILEGSRRKRLKFESSELPLFPENTVRFNASSSSASPSRPTPQATPFSQPYHPQMRQNYPQSSYLYSLGNDMTPPQTVSAPFRVTLPTPAPTIASCISDEDVAIQLMRLGEAPQFHQQQPIETRYVMEERDQVFPGYDPRPAADVAGYPSHKHLGGPIAHGREKKAKHSHEFTTNVEVTEPSDDEDDYDDAKDTSYVSANTDPYEEEDEDDRPLIAKRPALAPKRRAPAPPVASGTKKKSQLHQQSSVSKVMGAPRKGPSKPKLKQANALSLKQANSAMNALADVSKLEASALGDNMGLTLGASAALTGLSALSSAASFSAQQIQEPVEQLKPRCQRCRKSKKGCDRQRPCQRCKDAGIPAEQCISEDETGTRRGRANASKAAAAGGPLKTKNVMKVKKKKVPEP